MQSTTPTPTDPCSSTLVPPTSHLSDPVPIAPAPPVSSSSQFARPIRKATTQSPPAAATTTTRSRSVQFVTTVADRRRLAEWMSAEVVRSGTEKHIASKVVREFPALFPGNPKANLMRATRIWRQREQLLRDDAHHSSPTAALKVRAGVQKHSLPGRGRKRAAWSEKLQLDLFMTYYRLKCAGFVFNAKTLREAAVSILGTGESNAYSKTMKDPKSNKLLLDCLTPRWVRTFADRWQVNLDDKPAGSTMPMYRQRQTEQDEKLIAYHLGCLARQFADGTLNENEIEVMVPIHFTLNTTSGKTLGFGEEQQPDLSELMFGSRPMTLLVRLSGGENAKLLPPLVIFQDADRTYPLDGVPDDSPEVQYRTSPTGWVDIEVLVSLWGDPEGNAPSHRGKRVVFVEPSPWLPFAAEFEKPTGLKDVELRFLPRDRGCFTQPVEMDIRTRIKQLWKEGWQQAKKRMIDMGVWNSEGRDANGKMFNAGPRFFVKLAAAAVQTLNNAVEAGDMTLARRAMIQTGLSMNVTGQWELEQLHPELKAIAIKHKNHFEGEVVTEQEKPRPPSSHRQVENDKIAPLSEEDHQAMQNILPEKTHSSQNADITEPALEQQHVQQECIEDMNPHHDNPQEQSESAIPNSSSDIPVDHAEFRVQQEALTDQQQP